MGFGLFLLVAGVGAALGPESPPLEANLGLVGSILPGGASLQSLSELQTQLESLQKATAAASQKALKDFQADKSFQAWVASLAKPAPKASFLETAKRERKRDPRGALEPSHGPVTALDPHGPPLVGVAVLNKVSQTASAAALAQSPEKPVVVLPARLDPIPRFVSELIPGHRPLRGQVFRPLLDETAVNKPIGSITRAEDLHAGLDAIQNEEASEAEVLAAKLGLPKDSEPSIVSLSSSQKILEDERLRQREAKPVLPSALDDPEAALATIDKLLKDPEPAASTDAGATPEEGATRFAEVAIGARAGAGAPSAAVPASGQTGRVDLPAAFQQENDRDLPMDFLVSQGIVDPKFKQKKKAGKKILGIADEQVVSQTYAKAQTTLDRIQRTAYGMSQRVRVLNNVERELQRTLSYLGDQEFTMGGTSAG